MVFVLAPRVWLQRHVYGHDGRSSFAERLGTLIFGVKVEPVLQDRRWQQRRTHRIMAAEKLGQTRPRAWAVLAGRVCLVANNRGI